jgi:SAM-dependent methyltransferase
MSQQGDEIISRWSCSAPNWEKHREVIRQMFAPITEALIHDAEVTVGNNVLDVATGPGEPALRIAAVVGSTGRVTGIDPVAGMIEAARRAANRLGFKNARFEVASADSLPFSSDTFDAEVSRFGVMFFPSPINGISEMLRVLKPGKRLAFAVWHFAENNPFHYALSRVIDRYVDSPPLSPDAPDAFRFATPGKLVGILDAAGAAEAAERLLRFTINAGVSAEDFWTLRCEMSEKLRERLARLSADQMIEVKQKAIEAFVPYSTATGMSFPAAVLISTGRKRFAPNDIP